jgi:hypothetical protein
MTGERAQAHTPKDPITRASRPSSNDRSEVPLVRHDPVMRAAMLLLLVAATAHASPDPCTATALHLTKVTEVAPVVVGASCQIRSTDGTIDKERLHTTFPSISTVGEPGYGSSELTLPITSAKELAAAVTCQGELPKIDFTKHRAWVLVREVGPRGGAQIARGFDDGKTVLLADRTTAGCSGGARWASEPSLVTTIVVVPTDRTVERRACYVGGPRCNPLAK